MRADEDTQLRTRSIWLATSSVYTRLMSLTSCRLIGLLATMLCAISCASSQPQSPPASLAPSGNPAFDEVSRSSLEDVYQRQPTWATYLGIHKYNDRLDDYSRKAVDDGVASARRFRERVAAIDAASLSLERQLDREQLLRAIDSRLLTLEALRPWAVDPDSYSSGLTRTAYIMIKRNFAPPEERLRQLIAREKAMPAALADARTNLQNPPRIYTEIAIEQMDGNRGFFETAVASAFPTVTDQALLAEFKQANDAVIAAMSDYKKWLQDDLLKRSNGTFAIGEETYRRKLAADEMIELPLDELLQIAERDLRKNQAAFAETARTIDPKRMPSDVLKTLEADHPPPEKLLSTTQAEPDALGRFMTEKRIVTIPKAAPARVEETPPFFRATTSASMDIPGPFETVATEAYYNMTLPDPKLPAAEKNEFMTQWYYPAISNVSVHEVWPGHYLQFLYARNFPSDIRKVLGAGRTAKDGRITASRWSSMRDFTPTIRAIVWRSCRTRCCAMRGSSWHPPAHEGHDCCGGRGVLRQGRLPVAARRAIGKQAWHIGSDLRLLHDGKADDPEAPGRLPGQNGRRILAAGFPRHVHQAWTAAVAARTEGDARRHRPFVRVSDWGSGFRD